MTDASGSPSKSNSRPGGGWKAALILLVSMIYGIIPLDAIPDVIPVFGLGDDAAVILGAIYYVFRAYYRRRQNQKDGEKRD